jgi:hypothetical protein
LSTYKLNQNKAELIFYAVESIVVLIIGAVYELFSHQVYSPFMYLMFMIPLLLGVLPNLAARILDKSFITSKDARATYKLGILTLIFGSFLKGVLDIYGTSSVYPVLYIPAAIVLIIVALGLENYYKKGEMQ